VSLPAEGEAPAREVTTGADGGYVLEQVPVGERRLSITAEGFDPGGVVVTVVAGAEAAAPEARVIRTAAVPAAQLRGLIRSYRGSGLRATITVHPAAGDGQPIVGETDQDGVFTIDVAPGAYRVEIEANGYQSQERSVRVEENGVTVINADLRERRGR
jgi:hypothetical protein